MHPPPPAQSRPADNPPSGKVPSYDRLPPADRDADNRDRDRDADRDHSHDNRQAPQWTYAAPGTTIFFSLVAYAAAIGIGLIAGLGRVSKNVIIFNLATLYVQIIRGVPILVQIFYASFVLTPAFFSLMQAIGAWLAPVLGAGNFLTQMNTQNVSLLTRAVIALSIAYGGFEAETFRAGIE